ncbi:MAG: helix-turn-helix domain-containing protein [Chitinophagaceae bacterium]
MEKLGSAEAVARKIGISGTALSQWLNGKYVAEEDNLNHKIASALGYTEELWKIAETRDVKILHYTLPKMNERSLFVGISEKAGICKTASIVSSLCQK